MCQYMTDYPTQVLGAKGEVIEVPEIILIQNLNSIMFEPMATMRMARRCAQ